MKPLQDYKISPAAWASKAARHHALENAQDEIILCQQALVNDDLKGRPGVAQIEQYLKTLGIDWDGSIVPLDMMFSLCKGLINIFEKHPNDKSAGASILLSTYSAAGGYNDSASWKSFKTILVQVLKLCSPPNNIGKPADFIDARVKCKRVMGTSDSHANHSKMVCIDRSLLYVGSDNIYPQANMQHGVWIEDKKNIGAWYDQYFHEAWDKGVDAQN